MKRHALPDAFNNHYSHTSSKDDEIARRLRNQASLIGTVAHDLRHPLFQLALAVELADSIDSRKLETIRNALGSITRLVDDLDDYGSLQAGQLRLVCRIISPATIVRSALAAFQPIAAARQIEMFEQVCCALPNIRADGDRLHQVMSNLLMNALSITPPGGRVVVAVDADGDRVRFSVSDSGPGIHAADLPHLFERYWRGAHNKYVGRGLGLVIARDLVECHGGSIWACNEPECGARLSFTVPAERTGERSNGGLGANVIDRGVDQ